jgi:CRP/FNR family cyclic AMP-dependent transcriptional regulator
MSKSKSLPPSRPSPVIDWAGVTTRSVEYAAGRTIFSQGQPATSVMYVQNGTVRLSFLSRAGAQRIVAVIDQGAFFGEGCLAGQPLRMATATAVTACNLRFIDREEMVRQLHSRPAFTDAFLAHMLKRNIRIEEDLLDQMLNHTEKRLAARSCCSQSTATPRPLASPFRKCLKNSWPKWLARIARVSTTS